MQTVSNPPLKTTVENDGAVYESRLFRSSPAPTYSQEHLKDFSHAVMHDTFPCVFAPSALRQDSLLFGLADVAKNGWESLPPIMDNVVAAIEENPDQVVILWIDGVDSISIADDHQAVRTLLTTLLTADDRPWPAGQPIDPADTNWNFWYEGVDFFINFSTRHHVNRRSRNLGQAFTLVTQSQSSFDRLPEHGRKAREVIRDRISKHDAVGVSPVLGNHGDAPELPQFFLGDINGCPHLPLSRDDVASRTVCVPTP